jgi:chemotaxis protein methyltransferase CheR
MSSSPENRSSLFLLPAREAAQPEADYILQAVGSPEFAWERELCRCGSGVVWRRDPRHSLAAALGRTVTAHDATFFAERRALELLCQRVLPTLMARRRDCERLTLWSEGCGTGQPTYSLAMSLAEVCPPLSSWNVEIVASDADAASFARAVRGVYSSYEVQRGLPLEWLVRHFEQLPDGRGWRVNSALAGQITWLPTSRSGEGSLPGPADIIFCHRPLGSDSPLMRGRELQRMTAQLAVDGFLVLQAPEPALERQAGFERVATAGPAIYRRIDREVSLLSA